MTMNTPIPSEESRKLHDEEELRRYNSLKHKSNLKIYGLVLVIVILAIAWVIVGWNR